MKFLKKLFAPKEVRAALGVLDEANYKFNSTAFQLVRNQVEEIILARPKEFARVIQKGNTPRQWVYSSIANRAGDHVESGQHHFYRGALNPLGEDLLRLFDSAVDELVRLGAVDADNAETQKVAIRESIKSAG